ncbi:YkgJ family cysteine cluster protein [Sorangium sp. So ce302]|uniref:YkgJ family cysteine cluster protein n=1 Tax=unclassified Sorangium TaxID=2621164 RepID=UPI003F63F136
MARRPEARDARGGPALTRKGERGAARAGGARGEGDAVVPECTACGTCCFSTLPEYVRVFGCDYDRMDDRARGLTRFIGNRCYMRIEDGRCAALTLDAERGRFLCSIYEVRPDCCRALERGSGACLGDLHEKRERPLLALEALRRRAGGASGEGDEGGANGAGAAGGAV